MELLKQIDNINERIEGLDRDILIYNKMLDHKKMEKVALEAMVEKINNQIEKENGGK